MGLEAARRQPLGGRLRARRRSLLGLSRGDNPHQWYSPESVHLVIARIDGRLPALDPADAGLLPRRSASLRNDRPGRIQPPAHRHPHALRGRPVGYSREHLPAARRNLGLKLMTPYSFAKAIAEGTDVSARDKQTVDRQAQSHAIKVWIFNSQNATPTCSASTSSHVKPTSRSQPSPRRSRRPRTTFQQWQAPS